jgi:predicted MPP superfamily phosphohydrolase
MTTAAPTTKLRWRRRLLLLGMVASLGALGLQAFWIEPSQLVIHRARATWRGPALKAALLSDLHIGAPYIGMEKLRQVVEQVNAESPDVVMLAGDFVTRGVLGGKLVEPEPIAQQLSNLRAPLGVMAVLGNHDWWYDGPRVIRAFRAAGIRVLEDDAIQVESSGHSMWFVGLSDQWTQAANWQAALQKVGDDAPVLALTHNPDVFPEMPSRVDLLLAGHSHGGQVRFPLIGAPIVPSRFGQRYLRGFIEEGGKQMFVTTGIGTSMLPVRFGVPPEIVILTLESRGGS